MLLFKKGLVEGMLIGMAAGAVIGWLMKPSAMRAKEAMDESMPKIKNESRRFVSEMSDELKQLGENLTATVSDEAKKSCKKTKSNSQTQE